MQRERRNHVVFGGTDRHDNQPLFWNNKDGWVCLSSATRFTEKEANQGKLLVPYNTGGYCVPVKVR